MGSIKFYTIEDWVNAYLKEWGYDSPVLTSAIVEKLQKEKGNLHPDDVSKLLDGHIQTYLDSILPETGLPAVQRLNYFKMVFLAQKLYEQINLFDDISNEDEKMLIACFHRQLFQAAPDLIRADMFRQSIKTFHPVWKIKKTLAKGVKLVVKSVSGK